jgi:hypothetical protein
MPHPYAPPLLLVEESVLDGARGGGPAAGALCPGATCALAPSLASQPLAHAPLSPPPWPRPPPDHAAREVGRRPREDGPIFHVRGLCVATVYT